MMQTLDEVDLGCDTGLLVLVDDDAGVDETWDPEQEGKDERDDELGLADAGLHVGHYLNGAASELP